MSRPFRHPCETPRTPPTMPKPPPVGRGPPAWPKVPAWFEREIGK